MTESSEPSAGLKGDAATAATPRGLADRRELALIALERTRMPMVVTDPRQPDNPIILANQAFLDLTGYSAQEVIGRNCRFMQGEGTSPAALDNLRSGIAAKREVSVELLNYRKDGSAFWNQLSISPICDEDGKLIYYFGSQIDFTQRRRAQELEAMERRLLREVDHRAMNVLAIVQAIVRLSRADDARRYAAAVQNRVQTLARAHTILAVAGWSNVPLGHIIRGEIKPYGDDRVHLDGPEIAVPPQFVQPLALVFHELIVNTATHGALSSAAGALKIAWRSTPEQGTLDLHWRETGGPPPPRERLAGFGSTIIHAIVERQLGGEIRQTWDVEGLRAELVFPADSTGDLRPLSEDAAI